MTCDNFHDLLESYLNDALDEPERQAFRQHLRSCERCRERAVIADPTLLFAAVAPTEPRSARVERVAEAVVAQIRQERLDRRVRPRIRGWLAAAAAMLILVAGASAWRALQGGGAPTPGETVEAVGGAAAKVPPPEVRLDMHGEGVRVYEFADDGDDETAVYYVVNPALES